MPVIASATIPINVKEDHTIELLFLDEVKRCGCVEILSASSHLGVPLDELKDTIAKLVGDKTIECDDNKCCISKSYHNLVHNLNKL
jgi:hypothetical protein